MKTLDRYVIRTFLTSAVLWFVVLMSLRIVGDLFVNMDEFTEHKRGMGFTLWMMWEYYRFHVFVYFVELGGIIISAAATFSLARMNHSNELTAMLASGVNLHRVVWPIVACAMLLGALTVADQEWIIPRYARQLARDRDELHKPVSYSVMLVNDGNHANWYALSIDPKARKMEQPLVVIRDSQARPAARISGTTAVETRDGNVHGWTFDGGELIRVTLGGVPWPQTPNIDQIWTQVGPREILEESLRAMGKTDKEIANTDDPSIDDPKEVFDALYGLTIYADRLSLDPRKPSQRSQGGQLYNPRFHFTARAVADPNEEIVLGSFLADAAIWKPDPLEGGHWELINGRLFFPSDLTAEYLVLRRSGRWISCMSSAQLNDLIKSGRARGTNAILTKHTRFLDPVNNLIMLLLALPFILSRERGIKASASRCLLTVGLFYMAIYAFRYMGIPPIYAVWIPIIIFGSVASFMLASIKT